jgi:hypothetical protein
MLYIILCACLVFCVSSLQNSPFNSFAYFSEITNIFVVELWVFLLLGKTQLTKKAHEKILTFIEQNLMAGPNYQTGWE